MQRTMTKAKLVEQVALAVAPQVDRMDCDQVIDALLRALTKSLAQGHRIELRGFGVFNVRHRKSRLGHNPRTGEAVAIPACDVPVFQPSAHFRSLVGGRDAWL